VNQRIAIVGTGIAGLTVAWLLQRRHEITVFEREIGDETALVEEIRAGRCRAAYASEMEGLKMSEIWSQ